MIRSRSAFLVVALAMTTGAPFAAEPLVLDRDAVLARAHEHAPELLAERERLGVALGELRQARLWPYNPELRLAGGPRFADGDTTYDAGVGVSQRLPLSGRRSAAAAVARAGVARTRSEIAERTRRVVLEAVLRHLAAVRDREGVGLAEATVVLAERVAGVVDRRRDAGDADDLDANIAAIALARARARLRRARAEAAASRARLAALLGIEPSTAIAVEGRLTWPPPEDADRDAALRRHPELARLEAGRRAARAGEDLAAARAGVDPSLSLDYEREEGADVVHVGLTFEIPVAERGQGDRAAARAAARLATRRLAAARLRIAAEVTAAVERARALGETAGAFRDAVLPRLEANERLTDAAFDAGSLTIAEVLSQQREVLAARAELLALDHRAAVAAAEAAAAAALPPFTPDHRSPTPATEEELP